jgi:hypothetical protein
MLGIATRKAGLEIECPKCGHRQVVPSQEAAGAAMAMSQFAEPKPVVGDLSELVVYDDPPAAVDSPPEMPADQPGPPPVASPEQPGPGARGGSDEWVPKGMILFSRRTLYVQAVLLLVVAVVGFGAGYVIGRSNASLELVAAREEAARQRVLIDGLLVHDPGTGKIEGDAGTVIIILPEGKHPTKKLSSKGLRPHDPPPNNGNERLRAIEALGGAYARANADGTFSVMLPDTGRYRLLLISRHARRPAGSEIEQVDREGINQYFRHAEHLVGRRKYRWTREEFLVRTEIEHDFGRDGGE